MRQFFKCRLAASLLLAVAPLAAQAQPAAQRPVEQNPSPPPNSPMNTPELKQGVDEYLKSKSGQNGKQEPTASSDAAKTTNDGVFVNGALNVPGAPKDSQTVPAKFSARNSQIDKLPIVAAGLWLTDEQKRKIIANLRDVAKSTATVDVKVAGELPISVDLVEIPEAVKSEFPAVNRYKLVRLNDRVLFVSPSNRIVVGEIAN